jgi:16S rRNA (guanine527-N7)-methyltransferase
MARALTRRPRVDRARARAARARARVDDGVGDGVARRRRRRRRRARVCGRGRRRRMASRVATPARAVTRSTRAAWTRGRADATRARATPAYDAHAARLDATQRERMARYAAALIRENKGEHGTLTGATSAEEVLQRHASDALALLRVMDDARATMEDDATPRVLDVGSGAGLPGIPLAIARPTWRFTLLDTLRKRTEFLERATRELGLTNVEVVWGRAEDLGRDETRRERYDVVTARAVAELRVLAELCVPLVRVGGRWIAPKNAAVEAEMRDAARAVATLGGGAMRVERVDAVAPDGSARAAVVCEKIAPTPEKYPRRAGMAKKRPL